MNRECENTLLKEIKSLIAQTFS